jgi:tRNA(fMet)-specific endonuclease VapC
VNRYLLDTNTCIEYLRGRCPGLIAKIKAKRPRQLRLCSVVVAELLFGAHRSADPTANIKLVQELADTFISLSFDDGAAECFGQLRASLAAAGLPIGPYDLQIAAIALSRGLIVVTHNMGEFSRVPNLVIEDWQS